MSIGNILFYLVGLWNLWGLIENPTSIINWVFFLITAYFFYEAHGYRMVRWLKRNVCW